MNRLTAIERRRIRLAQERASKATLARMQAAPVPEAVALGPASLGFRRLAAAAMIAVLLGCGLLASQALEFHPPASLVEALFPRL
jgi:hypothetical protein